MLWLHFALLAFAAGEPTELPSNDPSPSNGPGSPCAVTPPRTSGVSEGAPEIVIGSCHSTFYANSEGGYDIGSQTLELGSHITFEGDTYSLGSLGMVIYSDGHPGLPITEGYGHNSPEFVATKTAGRTHSSTAVTRSTTSIRPHTTSTDQEINSETSTVAGSERISGSSGSNATPVTSVHSSSLVSGSSSTVATSDTGAAGRTTASGSSETAATTAASGVATGTSTSNATSMRMHPWLVASIGLGVSILLTFTMY